jgi:hypothetical protein
MIMFKIEVNIKDSNRDYHQYSLESDGRAHLSLSEAMCAMMHLLLIREQDYASDTIGPFLWAEEHLNEALDIVCRDEKIMPRAISKAQEMACDVANADFEFALMAFKRGAEPGGDRSPIVRAMLISAWADLQLYEIF